MFNLPFDTKINKGQGWNVAKSQFYERVDLSDHQERMFIDELISIRWINKISHRNFKLTVTEGIFEIEVFVLTLKGTTISEKLLKIIDTIIVHPIVYVIDNGSEKNVMIAYKEKNANGKVSVMAYYSTGWTQELPKLDFRAITTGELYQSLIHQISQERVVSQNPDVSLKDSVEADLELQAAIKYASKLEAKIKKTDQPNLKLDLIHELRDHKKKWGIQ